MPYVAHKAFYLILKWLFSKLTVRFLCLYNTVRATAVSAQICPPKFLQGPLIAIYKKKFCYATSRGRMGFKIKHPNCRHIFGRTRPVARF